MKWLGRHSRVALAVVSAIAGAVLGAVLQGVLSTDTRTLAAVTTMAALTVIGVVASQAALLDASDRTTDRALEQSKALIERLEAALEASGEEMSSTSVRLERDIELLADQLGMHVRRLLLSEINEMMDLEQDPTAQLMLGTTSELLVLDLLSEEGRWPEEAMKAEHSWKLHQGLEALIESKGSRIVYKRIVQVGDPSKMLQHASAQLFIEHCHAMLDLRNAGHHRVSLRVARQRFPFKFMLIDNRALILQLQEFDASGNCLVIWGEVLVTDPQGRLFSVFRDLWDQLDDDPDTRTLTRAGLPQLGPKS